MYVNSYTSDGHKHSCVQRRVWKCVFLDFLFYMNSSCGSLLWFYILQLVPVAVWELGREVIYRECVSKILTIDSIWELSREKFMHFSFFPVHEKIRVHWLFTLHIIISKQKINGNVVKKFTPIYYLFWWLYFSRAINELSWARLI